MIKKKEHMHVTIADKGDSVRIQSRSSDNKDSPFVSKVVRKQHTYNAPRALPFALTESREHVYLSTDLTPKRNRFPLQTFHETFAKNMHKKILDPPGVIEGVKLMDKTSFTPASLGRQKDPIKFIHSQVFRARSNQKKNLPKIPTGIEGKSIQGYGANQSFSLTNMNATIRIKKSKMKGAQLSVPEAIRQKNS